MSRPKIKSKAPEPTLKELAQTINREHKVAESSLDAHRDAAHKCGKALIDAKASPEMKHGMWLPWLKENCPDISERQAQNYMAFARGDQDRIGNAQESKNDSESDLPDDTDDEGGNEEPRKVVNIKSRQRKQKRKQKRQQQPANPNWDKEGQSIAYDPRVIAWVWDRLDEGWKRDQIVTASKEKTHRWPLKDEALSNGSEGECRAAIVHLKRVGMRPAPHNSRRSGPKHIAEINKAIKSASGNYSDLLKMQLQIVKMTDILECYSVEDLDIDNGEEATVWTLEDLLKDLTSHMLWADRTLSSIMARVDDSKVLETIAQLEHRAKDPSSEPNERESAARLAEKFKQKRERRLTNGEAA